MYGLSPAGYECLVGDEHIRSRCSGPLNAYARTKLEADDLLIQTDGLTFASFRFTNVFGPGESHKGRMACILTQLIEQAVAAGGVRVFADSLTASRDFVPVAYVADALCNAVDRPEAQFESGVFNLGSGVSISFARLLEWLTAQCGNRLFVDLFPNPASNAYQYWTGVEMERTRRTFDLTTLCEEDVLAYAGGMMAEERGGEVLT
jgi:ADP-L-glycero-D-manno-heptose 6-epimerase